MFSRLLLEPFFGDFRSDEIATLDDPLHGLLILVEAAVGRRSDQPTDHRGGDPLGGPRVGGDGADDEPPDLGRARLGLEVPAQDVLFKDSIRWRLCLRFGLLVETKLTFPFLFNHTEQMSSFIIFRVASACVPV